MCETLGFAHPRYLLEALTSREVTEWLAFFNVREEKRQDAEAQAKHQARSNEIAQNMSKGKGL